MDAEKKPEEVTYYSAVDWWLALIAVGAVVAFLVGGLRELQDGDNEAWILLGTAAFIVFLLTAVAFPCKYILTDRRLIIRSGLAGFGSEIEIEKIQSVSLSWNLLSAPAWSLKRVKIRYDDGVIGFMLISPKDRRGFMAELNRRRERLKKEERRQ